MESELFKSIFINVRAAPQSYNLSRYTDTFEIIVVFVESQPPPVANATQSLLDHYSFQVVDGQQNLEKTRVPWKQVDNNSVLKDKESISYVASTMLIALQVEYSRWNLYRFFSSVNGMLSLQVKQDLGSGGMVLKVKKTTPPLPLASPPAVSSTPCDLTRSSNL